MTSTLLELSKLITNSVSIIERICTESGTAVPDLVDHSSSNAFHDNFAVSEAANVAIAAAAQLIATLKSPAALVLQMGGAFYQSAAMRIAFETNTPEIIREAGEKGLHVDKIATIAHVSSKKLVRALRFLATHHVFREVEPDVFANNRLSHVLDTGKSVTELQEKPMDRYEGTIGMQALLGHLMDEGHKASAYMCEILQDPETAFSEEVEDTALNVAMRTRSAFWDWMEEPEQAYRLRRFGISMRGLQSSIPADAMLKGFDFLSLKDTDLIVDVAGGIGNATLPIARANSSVKILIQDRPAVVEEGLKYWKAECPSALTSGRVKFAAHDLFAEQPIKNASYAAKILNQLRKAAIPQTKLLLIDSIMHYTCHDPTSERKDAVPGWERKEAAPPLLPNFGVVNQATYGSDLHMFILHNAQERTIAHLSKLLKETGWKLTRVYPDPTNVMPQVEAVPI